MIRITRQEEFSAAHRLYNPEWSEEENYKIYGKCEHENYHGHNYIVEVSIKASVNFETGMAYNLSDLKEVMRVHVIDILDHKNLNLDVDSFTKKRIPTAENIAISIWEALVDQLPKNFLHRVRLYENQRNFVDYYGE
ncbi:MAG: 6-carboxytetrahydropterin synthase [Nitrospinota bacterium]|nr:6-carboxytetrahydropterin synthase [Nitrospinota bacterium]